MPKKSNKEKIKIQQPEIPINVQASDGEYTNKIIITWDISKNATSYAVYRALLPDGRKVRLGGTLGYNTTYIDTFYLNEGTAVNEGTAYYYFIRSFNSIGYSAYSDFDTGYCIGISPPPPPPSGNPSGSQIPEKFFEVLKIK